MRTLALRPLPLLGSACFAGQWQLWAGQEGRPGYADGNGANAKFNAPTGVCVLPNGWLAVADSQNACLRQVDREGERSPC